MAEVLGYQLDQDLADETGLARAGYAGDCCEYAFWESDVESVEVVAGYTGEA